MAVIFDIKHKKGSNTFHYKDVITEGITGIFGSSGSGKTTLLNLLAGIEKPSSGKITVDNLELFNIELRKNMPVHQRKTGYVFQDSRLFPHMSIRQNLLFGLKYLKKDADSSLFKKVVSLLELEKMLDKKPGQLSGGQQQRVAIGRALISEPNLLLLDEPFSNLDRTLRRQIISYLLRINNHIGTPMLIVSHDLEDLLRLSPVLMIIENGQIKAHDHYFNLCMNSKTAHYLGSNELLSVVDARVVKHKTDQNLVFLETNEGMGNLIAIQTGMTKEIIQMGSMVRVGIKPEDVAISGKRIDDISIQNQWEGSVTKIISREDGVFCLIDCGFTLLAQLTKASIDKLGIETGKKVFCLVKSKGVEMIHMYRK